MKTVFHINESNKWNTILANATNMMNYLDDHREAYQIEIVVNGQAILDLKRSSQHAEMHYQMTGLVSRGLTIVACAQSMKQYDLTKDDILNGIEIVASGVVELALKQSQDFAYIKP